MVLSVTTEEFVFVSVVIGSCRGDGVVWRTHTFETIGGRVLGWVVGQGRICI